MSQVYRCTNCGNVTRFDKSGDGKCDECGSLMNKTTDGNLSEEDKGTLLDKDSAGETGINKTINLDHKNNDLLSKQLDYYLNLRLVNN